MGEMALYPAAHELPLRAPRAYEVNYTHHFSLNVGGKDFNDHYVYRHANGLCVIGLAPTHAALKQQGIRVDFDVGKNNRADLKASGRRKRDARFLEENSSLCKVVTDDGFFVVRCCVKGQLLEVNERLISDPSLLTNKAATEGYIAILMPKPENWTRAEKTLLSRDEYVKQRE